MGNQEIKAAMSRIQNRSFNAAELAEHEAKLWREHKTAELDGFESLLEFGGGPDRWHSLVPLQSRLSVAKSGIDEDGKRYQDQALDAWQTGFTNSQKLIENLKNGDFKQIVIPSNEAAGSFEQSMQIKIGILTALFFVRHQGGSEVMDDFFTFARKFVKQQQNKFVYGCEMKSLTVPGSHIDVNTIERLLEASEKIQPQKMFSRSATGFAKDLQYLHLRRQLLASIESGDAELRALAVKLLARQGVICASSEDLLLAAHLQSKYKIDISSELEFFCKQSEVFKKPALDAGGSNFDRTEQGHIQDRVGHQSGSDRTNECDQFCTDGNKWFINAERGLSRGSKKAKDGNWTIEQQNTEANLREATMFCHQGRLLVRHQGAPDVPFVVFDKETLKPADDEEPWGVADGEEDYLKWTPLNTEFERNTEDGNRWMRASPMFSDGELIYMLVEYKAQGFESEIIKVVCEVYETVADRKLKRINEVILKKNAEGDLYRGCKAKQKDKGGHLTRGSMACNGEVLLWWSAHYFHVYEMSTGIRKKKEHCNSTAFVTTYDAKENWYYYMDAACYSWLKRCKIAGFKPRVLTKEVKELPDLPIVFDTVKGELLAQLQEEQKVEVAPAEGEEAKAEPEFKEIEKRDPRTDLFDLLSKQDDQELYSHKPQKEQKKRFVEPIANINDVCLSIVLSKMSTEAQSASFKATALGDKKLLGEEMLPYFKAPFAIYGSKSYFTLMREVLEEQLSKLDDGQITTMKQSNALNLLKIYQANIECLVACRIEMKEILPEDELRMLKALQVNVLEEIKLFEGQAEKQDEDLTAEEIFQLHIVSAAKKLNMTLESNLDAETRLEKLQNLERCLAKAIEDESSPEAKAINRTMPLMSTKKALKDIFEGNDEELAIGKRILTTTMSCLRNKVCNAVARGLDTKQYQDREIGVTKVIRTFTKNFCQELMVAYGNQLLIILEKRDIKKEGELSKEEQASLDSLKQAQERKKILEPMLYEAFILASEQFKMLIQSITKQVEDSKVYDWEESDQVQKFYDFISKLFNAENSLPRIALMFSLMMSAHKPEVTWLDEIAEALKNCAEGLNSYLLMYSNLPYKKQISMMKVDSYRKVVEESLRFVSYSIGQIAYRLIQFNQDESEEKKDLSKLNILQGGIEQRFIPSLSQASKDQIEGSFKITNDKQLQKLALESEDKVIQEASDSLLSGVRDSAHSQDKIELVLQVLQKALTTKVPFCPHARLGGDIGMRLTRATFSVLLKFTDSLEVFIKLVEDVTFTSNDIGDEEQGDQKVGSIAKLLKEQANDGFFEMLKQWEQASQMRRWMSKMKLNLSEKLNPEIEKQLREEITAANPSKEPFVGEFDEEQKQTIEKRFNEQFDKQIAQKWDQVVLKAAFLAKLSVPQAFRNAKKEQMMSSVKSGITNQISGAIGLFKNRSMVSGVPSANDPLMAKQDSLQRSLTGPRRGSINSEDGTQMKKIGAKYKRKQSVLVNEGSISKKDSEFDWRDRLGQWKQRQQTSGAVSSFEEQMKQQSQSTIFSVLGCLQASFTSEQLQERVETSLVNGLRRSAGLHLLTFGMNLCYNTTRFLDLIQWLQGALRNNRMQATHYLSDLEGCGNKAESGIRRQFFQIIERVLDVLKHEQLSSAAEYVHLLNALCWNFNREDHTYLVQLNVFKTIQCGDGTLMHPIFRSWGQEDTNFCLELNSVSSFSLQSRLRQVFEFLVNVILESLFVKKEEEKLDIGGEDVQSTLSSKQENIDTTASEHLLKTICDILFTNVDRYLRMKMLFPKDHVLNSNNMRFEKVMSESGQSSHFKIEERCPRDLADYINKNGGHRIFTANRKLDHFLREMKTQMFIQKLLDQGEIEAGSALATQLQQIASDARLAASQRTLANISSSIIAREYRVINAVRKCTWESLELEEPQFTIEEKSEVTGISVEEYKAIAEAAMKAKLAEEEKKRQQEEEALNKDKPKEEAAKEPEPVPSEPIAVPTTWLCSACTYRNAPSNTTCEMCSTPKEQENTQASTNEDSASTEWSCGACTMLNPSSAASCSMCQTAKPAVEDTSAFSEPSTEPNAEGEVPGEGEAQAAAAQLAAAAAAAQEAEEQKVEEEKKEEVKEVSEAERQAEEEKQIIAETKQEDRLKRYSDFLRGMKIIKEGQVGADAAENRLEGHMYTETSIFRVVRMLDQLIKISETSPEGYAIVQKFTNPHSLKHLIELSVESSTQNQLLVQKALQVILSLDLPQEILDESVKLAKEPVKLTDRPNQVFKLLLKDSCCLDLSKSLFLKFLFNRLEKSRRALYKASLTEKPGVNSVVHETMRTIRTLFTEADKNTSLRKIVNQAFTEALLSIQDLSESEIDSVMSLIPEASFQRMAIGTPCVNKEGKVFNVVGVLRTEEQNNSLPDTQLYPNFSQDAQALSLAGLYYDPENPERQDLLKEKMIYSRPLLDLDEEQTLTAARQSVFLDAASLEQLIEMALQDQSELKDEAQRRNLCLLQTFIVRGLYNMTFTLKAEYIKFLQQFDLLDQFMKFLLEVGTQMSASPEEPLVSSLLLELRADYLRELTTTSNRLTFGDKESGGGQIYSSDDGLQMIVHRREVPDETWYFKADFKFGLSDMPGKFKGPLTDSDPENNKDSIFVLPSFKLKEPSALTWKIMKYGGVIITDAGCDFDDLMQLVKSKIIKDEQQWRACAEVRWIVLPKLEDTQKILSIIESGSKVKNQDLTDRGFFLGSVLKHISQDIWDKVDKDLYKMKFLNTDKDKTFEEVSTVWSSQMLAELIEAKFPEEESFMQQISMGETFEMIRGGAFIGMEEEEKTGHEEDKDAQQQQKIISEQVMNAIENQSSLPDFTGMLTKTEKLVNSASEGFFNCEAAEKLNDDNYAEHFKSYIFNSEGAQPADIAKSYQTLLKTLRQSYSRSILLNILSNAAESLDESTKTMISSTSSFSKMCDLVHNDKMTSAHVNLRFGNPQMLEQSKVQIDSFLRFMKDIPTFRDYFVNDLLQRAKLTLEKAAENDFEHLNQFTCQNLRKPMHGSLMLDPMNLLFFFEKIFELGYVEEAKLADMLKVFFDLILGYALVFKQRADYKIGIDLLKALKQTLTLIETNLAIFEPRADIITEILSNQLLTCLTLNMNVENQEKLNERQKHVLQTIVQMFKLQKNYNRTFDKQVPIGFDQSQSITWALQTFKVIEEGLTFKSFLNKMRFKEILYSQDAVKIGHLARSYATAYKKFDFTFKKEVTATDGDLLIKIDSCTTDDLIEIKSENQTILTDASGFRSGGNTSMKVEAGKSATITFPVKPQIIQQSGTLHCRREGYSVDHGQMTSMSETAQCAAVQVVATHQSVIFVGGDDSIWGIGFRCQGQGEDKVKLRKIESPQGMRNFKKVAHGKFFRLVLTQEGRLFCNGQNRKYMMGGDVQTNAHVDHFHEIESNFFPKEENDKIVDCAGGKSHMIVVTQNGKIYSNGYLFYRRFSNCRHNDRNNEDYPIELRLPDQSFKAKQVWSTEKAFICYVTATNEEGVTKTFVAGDNWPMLGHGTTSDLHSFEPLKVPDGTHMIKISAQGRLVFGVDNHGNLWSWGNERFGGDETERRELYEFDEWGGDEMQSTPLILKYFKTQGLKVLDVSSGRFNAIVKCETKENKIVFYGMSNNSDNVKNIGGSDNVISVYKHYINKINIDGSTIQDFSMGYSSAWFLKAPKKEEIKSIDPENPDAQGLIHFYQNHQNKWKFLTADQYEAQKESLPDICFATRHPIKSFLERVQRQRDGASTDEDRADKSFPDLTVMGQAELGLNFDNEAAVHDFKTSNTDSDVSEGDPLYYSYSMINDAEKKVYATEEEAFSGGQPWDLNPIIFYRVKKPLKDMAKLPMIDLTKHFKQAEEQDSLSFFIMKAKISQKEAQEIKAVKISDENTIKFFKDVVNFTQEQDLEILRLLDQQLSQKTQKIEDCTANMFHIAKSSLKNGSTLSAVDDKLLATRTNFLFKFSVAFSRAVKYVSAEDRDNEGSISYQHFRVKSKVLASVINAIVDKSLESIPTGNTCEVVCNRRKAFEFGESGNVDHEGKYSIFGQIIQGLKIAYPDMQNFRRKGVDDKCYSIKFKGEGSIDAGGPFRDSLVNIVQEMEDGVVPLLIKSPNNRNDHGINRDCFIIDPASTSPSHLEMYRYVGGFIAYAILSKAPIPFNLAPTVWKQILGEKMTLADLESIDAYSSQVLTDLQKYGASLTDEDFEASVDQNFTTVLSNGEEVELCAGGQERKVKRDCIDEFIGLVLKARFSEGTQQVKAIVEGLEKVFMGNFGLVSYLTPEAIEIRACGAKEIDLERLKSITSYNVQASHEIVQRFWRVFENFTHAQRSSYLKFVWGRNRLPSDLSRLSRKHEVRMYTNMNENGFPLAHTCFFQLDIPYYRTDELMAQRLIQASELCGSVDTDNNNFAD